MEKSLIRDSYFKATFSMGPRYISGLSLPNPDKGPYKFVNCDFHPALREELLKYKDSEFVDCEMP